MKRWCLVILIDDPEDRDREAIKGTVEEHLNHATGFGCKVDNVCEVVNVKSKEGR
jgi:hypothetical protein